MGFELGNRVQLVKLDATKDTAIACELCPFFLKVGIVTGIDYFRNRYIVRFIQESQHKEFMSEAYVGVPGEWLQYICVSEKPKEFTGKVICVSDDVDTMHKKPVVPTRFTPGKVYSIEQGVLFDDIKNWSDVPFASGIRNIDEFNKKMEHIYPTRNLKFIEFKGFANE